MKVSFAGVSSAWLSLAALALAPAVPWRAAVGQEVSRLEPGMRVRVTAPDLGLDKRQGTVGAVRGDTLFLAVDSTVPVPVTAMTRLEVHRGTTSNAGKGMIIGGAIGAGLGIAAGVWGQGLCGFGEGEDCWTAIPLLGVLGGAAGVGMGAVIGSLSSSDRWERVSPYIVRVVALPRRGVVVGLSFSF